MNKRLKEVCKKIKDIEAIKNNKDLSLGFIDDYNLDYKLTALKNEKKFLERK